VNENKFRQSMNESVITLLIASHLVRKHSIMSIKESDSLGQLDYSIQKFVRPYQKFIES